MRAETLSVLDSADSPVLVTRNRINMCGKNDNLMASIDLPANLRTYKFLYIFEPPRHKGA